MGRRTGKVLLPNVIDAWKIPPLPPVDSADYCMDILLAVIEASEPPPSRRHRRCRRHRRRRHLLLPHLPLLPFLSLLLPLY